MLEIIEDRKDSAVLEQRRDLLSNLIRSSTEASDSQKVFDPTHRALLGNIFMFLMAGRPFALLLQIFPLSWLARS